MITEQLEQQLKKRKAGAALLSLQDHELRELAWQAITQQSKTPSEIAHLLRTETGKPVTRQNVWDLSKAHEDGILL